MSGLRLVGEVTLDGAGFERGLRHLGTSAAENLKSFVIGAAGIYGIEAALHKTIDTADELVTTSKRLAVTVEQLQTLRQAAKDNGVEFTALAGAFEKLDVARAKALGGGQDAKKYLDAFKGVGVGVEDLKSKTAADLFQGQIAATVRMTNPEQIAAPLKEIFGRAFGELIPVMKTDFDELGEKMKKMGAIMDTTTAVGLKLFQDQLSLISQVIIAQLAPALLSFIKWLGVRVPGKVEAAGGFWGTVFQNMRNDTVQRVGQPDPDADVRMADGRKNFFKALWKEITKTGSSSGQSEMSKVESATDAKLKAIEDQFATMADKLNHPIPPKFTDEDDVNKKSKRAKLEHSDSLISVGNFLGAGGGSINNIAEQQVAELKKHTDLLTILIKTLDNKPLGADEIAGIEFP